MHDAGWESAGNLPERAEAAATRVSAIASLPFGVGIRTLDHPRAEVAPELRGRHRRQAVDLDEGGVPAGIVQRRIVECRPALGLQLHAEHHRVLAIQFFLQRTGVERKPVGRLGPS